MGANPIKKVRDVKKMSQEALAKILGDSRQTVVNYENNPDSMPLSSLQALSDITGIPIDVLSRDEDKVMPSPTVEPLYEKKLKKLNNTLDGIKSILNLPVFNIDDKNANQSEVGEIKDNLNNILEIAEYKSRKPIVAAFGIPNSGKSTLFNHIIGKSVAPSGYQPLTSASTYYHHISEKPNIKDMNEIDDTIVAIKGKKPIYGHHEGLLKSFGTREGAYFDKEGFEPERIDVYLDCDILKEFTYLDVPGFGSERTEDDVAMMQDMREIDYIFFLSQTSSFLVGGNEVEALKSMIASRENLNSICILATHANSIGVAEDIEKMFDEAYARLEKSMTNDKAKYASSKKLRQRFKFFDCRNKSYCEDFNADFSASITKLINKKFKTLHTLLKDSCSKFENYYSEKKKVLDETETEEIDPAEAVKVFSEELWIKIQNLSESLNDVISKARKGSLRKWDAEYHKIIDENYIIDALERKGFKNNKRDIELLSSYLSDELSEGLNDIIEDESKKFSQKLEAELDDLSEWGQNYKFSGIDINIAGFDFQRAFAAGMSGVATFGALAFWAAFTAGGSNLGAYILCAKVVSALGKLGISIGSTAAVNAAIAAIGGPVTIGIAISLLAAIGAWAIFTGTWKKRLAKKFVETYRKENVFENCCDYIKEHWDTTKSLTKKCIDSMRTKLVNHYKNQVELRKLTDMELERAKAEYGMIYEQVIRVFKDTVQKCASEID